MAFAISYVGNEAEKAQVTQLIGCNGGLILKTGFDELFQLPDLEDGPGDKDGCTLVVKPEFASLGFVAVIADQHSRRTKYLQALALGLPTVSGKWITDSLIFSKNTSLASSDPTPLAWSKYLLPSGTSTYLNGAVRSRNMPAETPLATSATSFMHTIRSRPRLLPPTAGVLIVVSRKNKNKSAWERRTTFAFLSLALGAAQVRRVADLAAAKRFLLQRAALDTEDSAACCWEWVYVDGDNAVAEARRALLAPSSYPSTTAMTTAARGKRAGAAGAGAIDEMSATDGQLRVVNNEFVVQSLILGDLVD